MEFGTFYLNEENSYIKLDQLEQVSRVMCMAEDFCANNYALYKKYPDKKYDILMLGDLLTDYSETISFLKTLDSNNITILTWNQYVAKDILDAGLHATVCPSSMAMFHGLLKMGVKNFLIEGSLGFYIKDIILALKSDPSYEDVTLMISANSIDHADFVDGYMSKNKQFFIRPEDLELFVHPAISTIYVYGKDNPETTDIILGAYIKDHKWFGDIKYILLGESAPSFDNRAVSNMFGVMRSGCRQKCYNNSSSSCNGCDLLIKLGNNLMDNGVYVKRN